MSDPDKDLELRVREHLARVAATAPRLDLQDRVIDRVDRRGLQRGRWAMTAMVVVAILAVATLLVVLSVGSQTSNVFSNISNGLGQ